MSVQFSPDGSSGSQGDSAVHVIVLTGDVDIARLDELAEIVDRFRSSSTPNVDVDLTGVDFLDSTGLGVFFRLRGIAQARGGRIRLLAPNRSVRRALDLAGASDLIEVADV